MSPCRGLHAPPLRASHVGIRPCRPRLPRARPCAAYVKSALICPCVTYTIMSRRPSAASLSSIGSGLMKPAQLPGTTDSNSRNKRSFSNASFGPPARKASLNSTLDVIVERAMHDWDPDELFTKHTVAEVRAIQQRLRYEAIASLSCRQC